MINIKKANSAADAMSNSTGTSSSMRANKAEMAMFLNIQTEEKAALLNDSGHTTLHAIQRSPVILTSGFHCNLLGMHNKTFEREQKVVHFVIWTTSAAIADVPPTRHRRCGIQGH